jgi:hypothetical protein|tara:strand:+ start:419 stop:628 length:210 start_codon:yes stop_codon:yes gene_type:complete
MGRITMEDCRHYWVVPSPETGSRIKTCRICKETRDFSVIAADEFTLARKPSNKHIYGYKGGRPKGRKSA